MENVSNVKYTGEQQQGNVPSSSSSGMTSASTGLFNQGGHVTAQIMAPSVITGNSNTVNLHMAAASQSQPSHEKIEFNVQDCVGSFTGREDILEKLHEVIQQNKAIGIPTVLSQTRVVSGMGGVGKTETVRRYIQLYKRDYHHVIWINAESYSQARSSFLKLAAYIQIKILVDGKAKEDTEITEEIYNLLCKKLSLFVFDNAESFNADSQADSIENLLPRAVNSSWKPPALIITTRDRRWDGLTIIEINGFKESECYSLLISQLKFPDSEENRVLSAKIRNLCEGLPLVVQQAIAFIREESEIQEALSQGPYNMSNFLSDIDARKQKFIKTKPADSKMGDVFTVFQITFERLATRKHGKLALKCLDTMAHLNPDNIPTELLKHLVGVDERKLAISLNLLNRYNLVTRCDGFYRIHRMIQAVRLECNVEPKKETRVPFLGIVKSFYGFLQNISLNAEHLRAVLDNGIHISAKTQECKQESDIYLRFQNLLASMLAECGRLREARYQFQQLYEGLVQSFGNQHEYVIDAKENLGNVLSLDGKYLEAERNLKEVQQTYHRDLGPNHPKTLRVAQFLAKNFSSQGKYYLAQKYLEHVLHAQRSILGPHHPETLNTELILAKILVSLGDHSNALLTCTHVVEYLATNFSASHPDTLKAKVTLAAIQAEMGKYNEAKEIYTDIMPLLISKLGDQNWSTLAAKSNYSNVLGNIREQEERVEKSVKTHEKAFGVDHVNTLIAKRNQAIILARKNKLTEALELFEKVLQIQKKSLGPTHPDTIETQQCMGNTMMEVGKYDAARKVLTEVLEAQSSILGPHHPKTMRAKYSLANTFICESNFRDAREILEELLVEQNVTHAHIHQEALQTKSALALVLHREGNHERATDIAEDTHARLKPTDEGNPCTNAAKLDLASVFASQKKYDVAEKLYNEVLQYLGDTLSQGHSKLTDTKHNLAVVLFHRGKFNEAKTFHEDNLRIRKKTLGEEHQKTLETKDELARVLVKLGKYDQAAFLIEDIIHARSKELGAHHPLTLAAKHTLAGILLNQDNYSAARNIHEDNLRSRSETLTYHKDTLETKHELACVLDKLGESDLALEFFADVLNARHHLLGPDHSDTLATKSALELAKSKKP